MKSSTLNQISSKLPECLFTINGTDLIKETVLTLEFAYSNTRASVIAQAVINDVYDMNKYIEWDTALVSITYVDFLGKMFYKEFKVINIQDELNSMGKKTIALTLQDTYSYALERCHISRSFNTDLVTALKQLTQELGVGSIESLEYDYPELIEKRNFVIDKGTNALVYFTKELYKEGCTFYQDKTGIRIKQLDDLIPNTLPINGEFVEDPSNEYYMNRILEYDVQYGNTGLAGPEYRSSYFDVVTKKMVQTTDTPIDKLSLNERTVNLQKGTAVLDKTQSSNSFKQRELNLRRQLMNQNIIEMWVPGYIKNDLNQQYTIDLNGSDISAESQIEKNAKINGVYISCKIQEKIYNDTLLQKITIHRADESEYISR